MVRFLKSWVGATIILGCIWLSACGKASLTITPTPVMIEVPVTVEVTRIVTQQIVVEATPVPSTSCAPDTVDAADEIVIGAILPLSKPGAMMAGFDMQTALNLAVIDINDGGGIHGKQARLITYDSAGITERGAEYARRLITQDCAIAIVGIYHSNVGLAVAEVVHEFGIPLIVAEAPLDEITARRYPEVFRIGPADSLLADMPVQLLSELGDYNEDGEQFAVLVADGATVTSGQVEQVIAALSRTPIRYETLPVDLPATDFSSVIARIVTLDKLPDAIFLYVRGEPALPLQEQIMAAGMSPANKTLIVTGPIALDAAAFWQSVPDGVGTVVASTGPRQTTVTKIGAKFASAYLQNLRRWPESYVFAAYDAMRLAAYAASAAPTLTGADLIAALEQVDLELAAGRYSFPYGSHHLPESEELYFLWHQWPGVHTLYLQYAEQGQDSAHMPVIWPPTYRTASVLR
jgi:branched-chain amino acid transport system substrate-binding protein